MIRGEIASSGWIGWYGALLAAGAVFVLLAGAVWRLVLSSRRAEAEALTDGAVLLASDGVVRQASPDARALFGECAGRRVPAVLEGWLGADAQGAVDAFRRLESTGEPVDMLVRTADGKAFELVGEPSGAMIRLALRDARYVDARLAEADARVHAADLALRDRNCEYETLHALVSEAPIVAWHRTAAGEINWSAGRIRARGGSVTPEQAVDLVVARGRINRQPALAGEPQKSRIEIVLNDGAETLSLHALEIVRQDGSRIGFATDASTAAAAERTLTRFVQTMTETFAHLTVGLAIFDRNQTLALFNPALVQMWQVEPAWLARRPSLRDILDELRAIRRLPELEDFHEWRARLLSLFENTEAADYEELWHLADGSNIRVLARPHPHGSLAFNFDDVTERMRLEQRYRHSIDLRRATLDGLTEGIAVFGANGLLQFVNQAFHETWGTDSDTVYPAMHARQLIGLCEAITADAEIWQKLHGYITGEESRRAWTTRLRLTSGRVLTARFAPLPDGSTLAVFSDITETQRITEALIERDAALDLAETVRGTIGGLVQPSRIAALGTIRDGARALEAVGHLPDEARRIADALAGAAAELRQPLETAAGIAAVTLRPEPDQGTDIAETIGFVTTVSAEHANGAGVELAADLANAPNRVACPAGALRLIAYNLALDAIGRARAGGRAVIGAEGGPNRFAVHATATPSPSPDQGADSGDFARGDGAGPGPLDLVRRLAAAYGGEVAIDEDAMTGQARVTCRFGVPKPERNGGFGEAAGPGDPAYGGNVRALKPRAG